MSQGFILFVIVISTILTSGAVIVSLISIFGENDAETASIGIIIACIGAFFTYSMDGYFNTLWELNIMRTEAIPSCKNKPDLLSLSDATCNTTIRIKNGKFVGFVVPEKKKVTQKVTNN